MLTRPSEPQAFEVTKPTYNPHCRHPASPEWLPGESSVPVQPKSAKCRHFSRALLGRSYRQSATARDILPAIEKVVEELDVNGVHASARASLAALKADKEFFVKLERGKTEGSLGRRNCGRVSKWRTMTRAWRWRYSERAHTRRHKILADLSDASVRRSSSARTESERRETTFFLSYTSRDQPNVEKTFILGNAENVRYRRLNWPGTA